MGFVCHLFLINIILIIVPFLLSSNALTTWDIDYSYYFSSVVGILFVAAAIRFIQTHSPKPSLRDLLINGVMSAAALAAIFILAKPHFRVLYDEIDFIGISRTFFENHANKLCIGGSIAEDSIHCDFWKLNVRGTFGPFVISLVHSLLGYSINHGFLVNAICGFLIFFFGALFLERYNFSIPLKGAWMFTLLAFPSFSQTICSAGVSPLFLLFLLLLLLFFSDFWKDLSKVRLHLVILSLAIIASIRLEAILFLIPLGPSLFYGLFQLKKTRRSIPTEFYAVALVFYPAIIHARTIPFDVLQSAESIPFLLRHFMDNAPSNLLFLFGIKPFDIVQIILCIFFIAWMVLALSRSSAWQRNRPVTA